MVSAIQAEGGRRECDNTLEVTDGAARFNADDGFLVGLPEHVRPALHAFRTSIKASVGLEVRFDKMHAYNADMEAARREAPAVIEWPELDGHHGIPVLNVPIGSPEYVHAYMRGKVVYERRERILFNQVDAASGMWTVAIPTTPTVMTPHELPETPSAITVFTTLVSLYTAREVDDLFQQAVPLGNTVPMDELKDLVPEAELSLPAFNVVTGSYDPRSVKSTLLEFKTMWYGVKYTAVPRATAVDRLERSLLGDMQRGLAARDAAWHNTEPGQKGPLRDILDMSEYTGMVFGTVDGAYLSAIPLPKLHITSEDRPHTHVHAWPVL
eukprot:jgi/Tetstr1/421779/TSEL_012682.t1